MNSYANHKILVLARTYPNSVTPVLGMWVKGLIHEISKISDLKVVAPTPYCPPIFGLPDFTRFRTVKYRETNDGVDVFHPRLLTGPGYLFHNFEATLYYWSIRRRIDRLRREFPFNLIHAFFSYPDGVVAAKLGQHYNVPVIITEQASWIPWMENYPQVCRQAIWAAKQSSFHIALSRYARDTIVHFIGESEKLRIIPNGVDGSIFKPLPDGKQPNFNQIVCVGLMRHVKGIDVLLKAMCKLVKHNSELKLMLVGGGINRDYIRQEKELRLLAQQLGLERNVEFTGIKSAQEVAKYMRESSLLVLPSRRETFGSVLIEALACGIPVVATKCGGPEDFVNEKVGLLVPREDANALAEAIASIIAERQKYNAQTLRAYALEHFAWEQIARQTVNIYDEAINNRN